MNAWNLLAMNGGAAAPNLTAILPLIALAVGAMAILVLLIFRRGHLPAALLAAFALAASFSLLWAVPAQAAGAFILIDRFAVFFMGLILAASLAVTMLAHGYLARREGRPEEFYVLLLLATLGACVLVASVHFISLFLGLEILSVSLYGLIAYDRRVGLAAEAGMKYLVLAATSAAFLLFGMALVYAKTGSMAFPGYGGVLPAAAPGPAGGVVGLVGLAMIIVGVGFKLAVVPFHLWTPDVYQAASAPVSGFIATVSKGAMIAALLRLAGATQMAMSPAVVTILAVVAVASMFAGNLLALRQENVKRLLAYSSIAHLGYVLVAVVAGREFAAMTVGFYLLAYFAATLAAFGVVTVLSPAGRDAERLEEYRGLARRRPWLAAVFTGALLSLAGIPLTAGFIGKFFVLDAGAGAGLWTLTVILALNSGLGLFYYLRVVAAVFARPAGQDPAPAPFPAVPLASGAVLAAMGYVVIALGVYPDPLIRVVKLLVAGLS